MRCPAVHTKIPVHMRKLHPPENKLHSFIIDKTIYNKSVYHCIQSQQDRKKTIEQIYYICDVVDSTRGHNWNIMKKNRTAVAIYAITSFLNGQ